MLTPSSVTNKALTSSFRVPLALTVNQSPPGGTIFPDRRGPSKVPPVTGMIPRVPWGAVGRPLLHRRRPGAHAAGTRWDRGRPTLSSKASDTGAVPRRGVAHTASRAVIRWRRLA